ncbi:MAG: DUF2752 domain-containing protein [Eubacteriales bacterium]|nr:DUF2752 domain-containing protein [Eubacteriales bacterium]
MWIMYRGKYKTLRIAAFLIIVSCALVYYYTHDPAVGPYPPCPFYYFTGLYCPGCGSSRALHQLLHGNFLKAIDLNPLMVISIPFILYLLISTADIRIRGRRILKRILFKKGFYTMLLSIIIVYWVIRNIPFYPFNILAP